MASENAAAREGMGTALPSWAIATALGGILLGHGLAYAVVQPDAHARAGLLAQTGHAYLHLLEAPAAFLSFAMVGVLFLSRVTRRDEVTPPARGVTFWHLAGLQVAAFVGMEVAERLVAGVSLTGLLHGGLLAIGVVTQLLVAAAIVWIMRRVPTIAARTATALRSAVWSAPGPALAVIAPPAGLPHRAPERSVEPIRGPPPPLG
jgi:hypothetical protein